MGATVISTPYSDATWWSRHFYLSSRGVTGQTGKTILKAKYEQGMEPLWEVDILDGRYAHKQDYYHTLEETEVLMARPENFIPTEPDFIVQVTSRKEAKRSEVEFELKQKSEDQAAETLFRDSPDYWPEHSDKTTPSVKDRVEALLIKKRWQRASKTPLGPKEDFDAIRAATTRDMGIPSIEVHEVRWMNPTIVMVSCVSTGGASYISVLRKDESGWALLTYYLEFIS